MEEAVLPAFENLMVGWMNFIESSVAIVFLLSCLIISLTQSGEASQLNVLPSCVSTMTNLCADPHIRRQLTSRKSCWEACSKTLVSCILCQISRPKVTYPVSQITIASFYHRSAISQL